MRTDMSIPLWQFFETLGKRPSKENCITLCTIAASMPDIFYYAYRGPNIGRASCMAQDIAGMYCRVRDIPFWSPYAGLARNTLRLYVASPHVYTDKATLEAIFNTLDDAIVNIRKVLTEAGLPELSV